MVARGKEESWAEISRLVGKQETPLIFAAPALVKQEILGNLGIGAEVRRAPDRG
jgi:hypothetical protein